MKKSVLHEKSFSFAIRCTKLYRYLVDNKRDFIISKQFLRSGTAIGALIHEGKYAESKLDFIHKYAIALKECNETIYWLELLYRTDTINDEEYTSIITDAQEIKKILSSSILTVKTSLKKSNHEYIHRS